MNKRKLKVFSINMYNLARYGHLVVVTESKEDAIKLFEEFFSKLIRENTQEITNLIDENEYKYYIKKALYKVIIMG